MRDGVESPDQLSGQHVERAEIAGSRTITFAGVRAQYDQVLEDAAWRSARATQGTRGSFSEIHTTMVAKRQYGFAGKSIDLLEVAAGGKDEPPVRAILAFPVIEAAVGRVSLDRMGPNLLSRARVERDDGAVFPDHVHDLVDD